MDEVLTVDFAKVLSMASGLGSHARDAKDTDAKKCTKQETFHCVILHRLVSLLFSRSYSAHVYLVVFYHRIAYIIKNPTSQSER